MKKKLKIWLIVSTVLYGILVILSIPVIIMSPMMFDAPGSLENGVLNMLFASLVVFPVVVIISIIAEWILYNKGKIKISLIFSFLPIADVLIILSGILLM